MDIFSLSTQDQHLPTPPASDDGFAREQLQGGERYSLKTAEINKCRVQKPYIVDTGPSPPSSAKGLSVDIAGHGIQARNSCKLYEPLNIELSDRGLEEALPAITHREDAIRTVRNAGQSLGEIRNSLLRTTKEYFPRSLMVRLVELPALRELRKSLDQLIATLERFEQALRKPCRCVRESDIEYMIYQIRLFLNEVIGEALRILKFWNHREEGQKEGQPLKGKDLRLRRIAIHDSDEQLAHLTGMVKVAEERILQEQRMRPSLAERQLKFRNGLRRLTPLHKRLRKLFGNSKDNNGCGRTCE